MSELLPTDWSQVPISSLGETFNGLTGKSGDDFSEGEPFVTYLQVFNGKTYDKSLCGKVRINASEKQNRLQYGDLLFTTSSETADDVGYATAFLTRDFHPFLNSFCFGFRLNNWELFDPHFAKHYLLGDRFRRQMIRLAQGSTRYNLSKTEFLKTDLSLPSLKEQQKIAEILTSVDEVIENTQSQIDKLEDLKKATMNELLTRGIGHTEFKETEIGRIPKSWRVGPLGDFFTLQRGHDLPVQDRVPGSIPIYGSNGIVGFNNETLTESEGVITGRSGSIGDVHYARGQYWALNTTLYVKDFKSNHKRFVFYFLTYFQLERYATGTGVPTLNRNDVHPVTISLPGEVEQLKIVSILDNLTERVDALNEKRKSTVALKKSLMQDLLTGTVRVFS